MKQKLNRINGGNTILNNGKKINLYSRFLLFRYHRFGFFLIKIFLFRPICIAIDLAKNVLIRMTLRISILDERALNQK